MTVVEERSLHFYELNVDVEYQDWLLIGGSVLSLYIFCLPCLLSRGRSEFAREFTLWVQGKLLVWASVSAVFSFFLLSLLLVVCPDWNWGSFAAHGVWFISWLGVHLPKALSSMMILFAFFIAFRLRDRILKAAGLDKVPLFKSGLAGFFDVFRRYRSVPVEVFIWKAEDLASGSAFQSNDVFVEVQCGFNEPVRTRVHNNAGSRCSLKESLQMNFDPAEDSFPLDLIVKHQGTLASSELGRVSLSPEEVNRLLEFSERWAAPGSPTGGSTLHLNEGAHATFLGTAANPNRTVVEAVSSVHRVQYDIGHFTELRLVPRGKIWVRIQPVEDEEERRTSQMLLSQC